MTAFATMWAFATYGYKLNVVDNTNVSKLYKRYREKNNIPLHYAPGDKERLDFEDKLIRHVAELYKKIYKREFVYPGTEWDQARFTEIVNAMDVGG